ncbi:type VII secretion protein EccB [Mycobacterium sp. SP-6446]|uniref:type VII secretion protein EccB n=1 Tax=Mycobacterium sp. SP-6446 TaxID=1834162 RepID=UPI00096E1AF2|nr:type VII secretion protein EccB [Mycobacterium sp. SP-6446]OMC09338.1 type VII secretion protein EccB [Mycobacterium sp. SP-6446]
MPPQSPTRVQIGAYRFLLRRIECALLSGDTGAAARHLRARRVSLTAGCALAAVVVAGSALLALLRPQVAFDRTSIVMGQQSGALYVRVGDIWHPVLNLASARLIARTNANPQPVRESDLARTKRGPLLGIPGAPQILGPPLSADESVWTICDTAGNAPTTILVGPAGGPAVRRLRPEDAVVVAPSSGSPAYLLYNGQRAIVDLADSAVVRALRLEGRTPRVVATSLLSAIPEAPPITPPRIRDAGAKAAGLPGFSVGDVLRITRAGGDEYYVVLAAGAQRIGQVTADMLRLSNSHGNANIIPAAPDAIRAAPIVTTLPVASFPDHAPRDGALSDADTTVCASWTAASGRSDIAFLAGSGLPLPVGQVPVTLAQADGLGPALDAVYLPPGRVAYVRGNAQGGARYLVTDTGVRFAIHDDDAAHDLGLPTAALTVFWPMVAVLPSGPELSRQSASVARDTVAGPP